MFAGVTIPAPLYVLAGGVIAAILDWWKDRRHDASVAAQAARTTAGTVQTSDSGQLWDEGVNLRHFMAEEIGRLSGELAAERDRSVAALAEMRAVHDAAMAEMSRRHAAAIDDCNTRMARLEATIAELKGTKA